MDEWQLLKLWDSPIEAKYVGKYDGDSFTKDQKYSIMGVTKNDQDRFNFLVINNNGLFCQIPVCNFSITKTKLSVFMGYEELKMDKKVK